MHILDVPVFNQLAPQGTPFPYITMSLIDQVPSYGWPDKTWEMQRVQFSIFAKGDSTISPNMQVELLANAVKEAFDNAKLTVDGYTSIMCKRDAETEIVLERVWQRNIDYLIENEKN